MHSNAAKRTVMHRGKEQVVTLYQRMVEVGYGRCHRAEWDSNIEGVCFRPLVKGATLPDQLSIRVGYLLSESPEVAVAHVGYLCGLSPAFYRFPHPIPMGVGDFLTTNGPPNVEVLFELVELRPVYEHHTRLARDGSGTGAGEDVRPKA